MVVAAFDDAVAMKRALNLPGAVAWDIWRGVKHVGLLAAPAVRPAADEAPVQGDELTTLTTDAGDAGAEGDTPDDRTAHPAAQAA